MVELDIQKSLKPMTRERARPGHGGHRGRLRAKYAAAGALALADYELLELLLSYSIPRRDAKPYAKRLLGAFQNLRRILEADLESLKGLGGLPAQSALHFKAMGDLFRLARAEPFRRGRVLSGPEEVVSFLKESIGSRPREVFTALYLDHRNHLLAFEHLQEGTVDHTAVYPREILRRTLELHATGLILSHNHPAGSLEPSEGDKQLTRQVLAAARPMGVTVHDHLILAAEGHFSFRQAGLLA
jgi:DNA repair protein RadC